MAHLCTVLAANALSSSSSTGIAIPHLLRDSATTSFLSHGLPRTRPSVNWPCHTKL
ncbi:hypothetical protein PR002_g2293 [Phytophthora rubi]|uniref:Uncharacterized protein n=1 Tax=Phytophthora rubi TaxID=129364 RepID=A0A6A3NIV7_9STRA|nr:hypothetical protein PR002_g2293 [Phytophthora rubi]